MRMSIFLAAFVMLASSASADLGDFPDNFMTGSAFDGFIVVGTEGSAADVASQVLIGEGIYREAGQDIIRLDSEIGLDHNLVLIGNPCVNLLTAKILGSPKPCDRNFPAGKAKISYREQEGFRYIIVAGRDSPGTRKAVEYLMKGKAQGEEVVLGVESVEPETERKVSKETRMSSPVVEEKTFLEKLWEWIWGWLS